MPAPAAAALPFIAAGTEVGSMIAQGKNVGRQYKYNKKMAKYQNKLNRQNQEWALEQNRRLLEEQRLYDSPQQQMARYKEGGLNPHLIYGGAGGGSQPIQIGAEHTNVAGVDASYPTGNPAQSFIDASQTLAQTGLTQAKQQESEIKQELMGVQRAIAATNPMLNPMVYEKTVAVLMNAADLKYKQDTYLQHETSTGTAPYQKKIEQEIEAMAQKLGLNTKDLEIKNKILQSKEYENALKEIQVNWMKNADITPQHIYQGIMLLLMKMM